MDDISAGEMTILSVAAGAMLPVVWTFKCLWQLQQILDFEDNSLN
jgi:hypothetical protein